MQGIGAYQGSNPASAVASGVYLALCHLCGGTATAIREARPRARIILRADLGVDAEQVDPEQSPESQAEGWLALLRAELSAVPEGTYDLACGPNEWWPKAEDKAALQWRAAFEAALCRRVQDRLGLGYCWGSIPVGNLEPEDVPLFADVFRQAAWTNYHAYLKPGNRTPGTEVEPYWLWRPTRLWLPELRKLGIPLRLVLGECGTFEPWAQLGLGRAEAARVCIDIEGLAWLEARRYPDVSYLGACAYGFGTMGQQETWNLEGEEGQFAERCQVVPAEALDGLPAPEPVTPPVPAGPVVGEGFRKVEALVGGFREGEVWHFPGTEGEVSVAVGRLGVALWRRKTNRTVAVLDDGRTFADGGNAGAGIRELR